MNIVLHKDNLYNSEHIPNNYCDIIDKDIMKKTTLVFLQSSQVFNKHHNVHPEWLISKLKTTGIPICIRKSFLWGREVVFPIRYNIVLEDDMRPDGGQETTSQFILIASLKERHLFFSTLLLALFLILQKQKQMFFSRIKENSVHD